MVGILTQARWKLSVNATQSEVEEGVNPAGGVPHRAELDQSASEGSSKEALATTMAALAPLVSAWMKHAAPEQPGLGCADWTAARAPTSAADWSCRRSFIANPMSTASAINPMITNIPIATTRAVTPLSESPTEALITGTFGRQWCWSKSRPVPAGSEPWNSS